MEQTQSNRADLHALRAIQAAQILEGQEVQQASRAKRGEAHSVPATAGPPRRGVGWWLCAASVVAPITPTPYFWGPRDH